MRTPVFELHILPMMRETDREHMRFAFDLWDYGEVVANANLILTRVAVDMPPTVNGGPWPDEWVDLFRRWRDTGFRRLELGSGTYAWSVAGPAAKVTATGTFPAAGYKGWLQLETGPASSRNYVLFFEPPDSTVPGAPASFTIEDRYPASDSRSVTVRDASGVHIVH